MGKDYGSGAEYTPEEMRAMRDWIDDCEWRDIDGADDLTNDEVIQVIEKNYHCHDVGQFLIEAGFDSPDHEKPKLSQSTPASDLTSPENPANLDL